MFCHVFIQLSVRSQKSESNFYGSVILNGILYFFVNRLWQQTNEHISVSTKMMSHSRHLLNRYRHICWYNLHNTARKLQCNERVSILIYIVKRCTILCYMSLSNIWPIFTFRLWLIELDSTEPRFHIYNDQWRYVWLD